MANAIICNFAITEQAKRTNRKRGDFDTCFVKTGPLKCSESGYEFSPRVVCYHQCAEEIRSTKEP